MKKLMKKMKKMICIFVVSVVMTALALPAFAEVRLEGGSYYDEEITNLEGTAYNAEEDDYSELYADKDMSAIDIDGNVEFIPTGENYYDINCDDSFVSYQIEYHGVVSEAQNSGITGINLEQIPTIPYGGDPGMGK